MNITLEQIRALRAGIEADQLAAEYIFEWKWFYRPATPDGQIAIRMLVPSDVEPPPHLKPWTPADGECGIVEIVRPAAFSSDWNAMEQVVIQMRQRGWEWGTYSTKSGFMVGFDKTVKRGGDAKFIKERVEENGAPLAVVKAALLALCAEHEGSNG